MENLLFSKEKTTWQILNNFIIIKSIKIIIVYVSGLKKNLSYFSLFSHTYFLCLTVKKKNHLVFLCSHTHTNYLSEIWQHFAPSFLFSSSYIVLSWLFPFSLNSLVRLPFSLFSIQYAAPFSYVTHPRCCYIPYAAH